MRMEINIPRGNGKTHVLKLADERMRRYDEHIAKVKKEIASWPEWEKRYSWIADMVTGFGD